MTQQKGKLFYGYAIMVSCIIMLIVGTGIIVNTVNQFVLPITEQMGISRVYVHAVHVVPEHRPHAHRAVPEQDLREDHAEDHDHHRLPDHVRGVLPAVPVHPSLAVLRMRRVHRLRLGVRVDHDGHALINNWFIKNKGTVMGIAMAGRASAA